MTDMTDLLPVRCPVIITNEGMEQDGSVCDSWDPSSVSLTSSNENTASRAHFDDGVVSTTRICDGNNAYCASFPV